MSRFDTQVNMLSSRIIDLRFFGCLGFFVVACSSSDGDITTGTGGSDPVGTAGNANAGDPSSSGGSNVAGGGGANPTSGTGGASGNAGGPVKSDAGNDHGGGTADSGPPVVVGKCDGLGTVGTWVNISPMVFTTPPNMETLAVVVDQTDQSVYASAGNKTNGGNNGTGVYKSTDCGATWKLVSTGTASDKLLTGDPWAMLIDPVHPQTLYINNGYGNGPTIYKSTNGGVDWTALSPNPAHGTNTFVQAIAMEAANPQHLAVSFHEDCATPYNGFCLSRTNDGGTTWQMFNGPSALKGWQEAATLSVLGPKSYFYAANGGWFTVDEGQTWTKVIDQGFYASYAGSTDIAPDGTMYVSGANSLYSVKTSALGGSWSPIAGSPHASSLIDDGVNLFASYAWDNGGQPFYTAKLSNLGMWTHMPSPPNNRGPNQFAYDASHHIVYSANWAAGLWRLVTR